MSTSAPALEILRRCWTLIGLGDVFAELGARDWCAPGVAESAGAVEGEEETEEPKDVELWLGVRAVRPVPNAVDGRSDASEGKRDDTLLAALLGMEEMLPPSLLTRASVVEAESSEAAEASTVDSSDRTARAVALAPEDATCNASVDAVMSREMGEGATEGIADVPAAAISP